MTTNASKHSSELDVLERDEGVEAQAVETHGPTEKPLMNPYLAGFGLGLVLLASFVVMGRGLGASGAFSSMAAVCVDALAPGATQGNDFWLGYLQNGIGHPLKSFLVFEVIGVMLGALISGALAGRVRRRVERGPRISVPGRMGLAVLGGALMGIGAKLARGCTSGQALSGGALLNLGSWAFMLSIFASAYALAWFLRRQWT